MSHNAGEQNGRAKLTWAKVEKIRKLYHANNCTQKELAKIFGVSRSVISYAVNYRTWRQK
ncbi:MAG: helix-turn-helix domain-containing protein [Deltaproteobacteria bacterium]|nr:MAG: helix-turn-helix domain-containing protein [Deltaproteobacteria bacterium]